jgi:Na+/glutamate symporter
MNETIAKGMTYGGSGGAFLFGMDSNTIGMICGVIIGVAGLLLTWHYQRRRDKREQAEYDFRMGKR